MSTETMADEFEQAAAEAGCTPAKDFPPFLPLHSAVDNWVVGEIRSPKTISFKQKGKTVSKEVYEMEVHKTNITGVEIGGKVTVSPAGLLAFQLAKDRPAHVSFPAVVSIKYLGRDEQNRHKTEIRWPKAS